MPTENEKQGQKQKQDSSRDQKRGGMGQGSGRPSSPNPAWEEEPGQGKNAGGNDRTTPSSPSSSQPWRDREEGDTDDQK